MKVFHCDHCQQLLFFENVGCVACQRVVAFLPDVAEIGSLEPLADGIWHAPFGSAAGRSYRKCRNYAEHDVCNWAIPVEDANPLCRSCRLTQVIPDLDRPGNRELWYKLEVAKRRLLYTLFDLGLPVANRTENAVGGLVFEFRADEKGDAAAPAVTGHANGVITINVGEADDAERERRRVQLHEPYRTLLGHFRHEIGHYYWDRLVAEEERLEAFRGLFGDEREDYAQALQRHYDLGAREGWQENFVSAYAAVHPWEDWAETWAHYLHMADALDTAAACGVSVRPRRADEPSLGGERRRRWQDFGVLADDWFALTYVLNNLNRGLGLPDGYPFVLSPAAIAKLRFVHDTIQSCSSST